MAIGASGISLSIDDIATEFGGDAPHSIDEYYRGGAYVPDSASNVAIPTSSTISAGDFYGSVATPPRSVYTLTIAANVTNYNVYTNRSPSYVSGMSDITVAVSPGYIVGSADVSSYSMSIPNAFSPGDTVTIINNGQILGAGGQGGAGSYTADNYQPVPYGTVINGASGVRGGNAILAQRPVSITNNGTVGSGGGGGGGSNTGTFGTPCGKRCNATCYVHGAGGGGGAGSVAGIGGVGGPGHNLATITPNRYFNRGASGAGGSVSAAGAGGTGGAAANVPFALANCASYTNGAGGVGGGIGQAGSAGGYMSFPSIPAQTLGPGAGSGGNYITGNAYVTWTVTGSRIGGVA